MFTKQLFHCGIKLLLLSILVFTPNFLNAQDIDGDGVVDSIDIDDDNDGILDYQEGGLGTLVNPITHLKSAYQLPSGRYYFDLGNGVFQADIDNSEGGGWILILQYVHKADTNPELSVIEAGNNLPVLSTNPLGEDESSNESKWGHAGTTMAADLVANGASEIRFYGVSSDHSRVIHFSTKLGMDYISTGTGSFAGIDDPNNHTLFSDHTANIPVEANRNYTNRGDNALTEYPFYRRTTYHWGIKGAGTRWGVDNYTTDTDHTIHKVWVRYAHPSGTSTDPIKNIQDAYHLPSGRYYFNLGSGIFQADIDNSEGGGWILIGQYVRQKETNPSTNVIGRANDLPILSNAVLGDDESSDTTRWGHAGNQMVADFTANGANEVRFYGVTENHSRVVHFSTNLGLDYIDDGNGSFNGISNSFYHTTYADHTANLPVQTNTTFSNRGNDALTNFPFYRSGNYHWAIRGLGNRWEVDDYGRDDYHTIHKIWIRNSNPFTTASNDFDGDTVADHTDLDADNDGIPDNVEAQDTFTYIRPLGIDSDGNGLDDAYESSPGAGEGLTPIDTDSDSIPDYLDVDSDSDNLTDNQESGITLSNSDNDLDGLDDTIDESDNPLSGNPNYTDPNGTINNPSLDLLNIQYIADPEIDVRQADTDWDNDGATDEDDIDSDNDGIIDEVERITGTIAKPITDLAQAHNFTNGRYYFDLGNGLFQAEIDNTNGGGWILILQYVHQGGTNPDLNVLNLGDDLPVQSNAALGADESSDSTRWGHAGISITSDLVANGIDEIRFYAISNGPNSNTIHFSTPEGIDYIDDGIGSFDNVATNFTPFSDHNARIPEQANRTQDDHGDEALTNHPFYTFANYHWNIKVEGDRWDVDDWVGDENNTIHRIWVRNSTAASIEYADSDGDGVYNIYDQDSDNDGIPDNIEAQSTIGYTPPSGIDSDGNGLDDAYESTPGAGEGIIPVNTEADANPDYVDIDSDNDGLSDLIEGGIDISSTDADNDGFDDIVDTTTDLNPYGNPNYNDPNGLVDTPSVLPNFQYRGDSEVDFRQSLFDTDGDGVMNEFDIDDDNDGITDFMEQKQCGDLYYQFIDGFTDTSSLEDVFTSDLIATGKVSSFDVVALQQQEAAGEDTYYAIVFDGYLQIDVSDTYTFYVTEDDRAALSVGTTQVIDFDLDDPSSTRSGSIYLDAGYHAFTLSYYQETGAADLLFEYSSSTITQQAVPIIKLFADINCDFDNDGIPNMYDLDSDGDGIPDNIEGQSTDGYIPPSGVDSDGNGLDDAYESSPGAGEGILPVNTDGATDGNDFTDLDSDNDGISDTVEAGITLLGVDTDGDGLDDGADNSDGYNDPNGNLEDLPDNWREEDGDRDGDGILNSIDIDNDNDGILDTDESTTCNITTTEVSNYSFNLISINKPSSRTVTPYFYATSTVIMVIPSAPSNGIFEVTLDGLTPGVPIDLKIKVDKLFCRYREDMSIDIFGPGVDYSDTTANPGNRTLVVNDYNPTTTSVTYKVTFQTIGTGAARGFRLTFYDSEQVLNEIVNCSYNDIDGDGISNEMDLDSDNDGCTDAIEAYDDVNADIDADGIYGYQSPTVDLNGGVVGAPYTTPVDNYNDTALDFLELNPDPIQVTTFPEDARVCTGCTQTLEIVSPNATTYQWQSFNGTSWENLLNGSAYSGVNTSVLTIHGQASLSNNQKQFRVVYTNDSTACWDICSPVILTEYPTTIKTNRKISYGIKNN